MGLIAKIKTKIEAFKETDFYKDMKSELQESLKEYNEELNEELGEIKNVFKESLLDITTGLNDIKNKKKDE